ncbi:hypothetical protein BH10BAC1_BH10BAC1_17180 [soil metagenome]
MKKLIFTFSLLISINGIAQKNLQFTSIDSLFLYSENHSLSIKNGEEQTLLAKWTKLAALGNTINLRSPISASWTDNTELPVNYVPSEFFGGPAGTYKPLSFGQEYLTNYSITPQIDIINLANWTKIKSASINEKLTETTNLLIKKNTFESIAAAYYNIISMQEQIVSIKENILAADSISNIVNNKFNQGIVREQDKNNATINLLNVKDKYNQLISTLEQQYYSLKLLCDMDQSTIISISQKSIDNEAISATLTCKSSLLDKQSKLQTDYLRSELRSSRMSTFAPVVSFIFNQSWQESSNIGFFDSNANKYGTQYFGLKVTVPLPFDVSKLSQNYITKINYAISKNNSLHGALQNQVTDKQLELDYQKALSTQLTTKQIKELKDLNYSKSMNQYVEGILSTENLLLSFNDKINAQLNYISASSTLQFIQTKIKINNTIQ